MRALLPETQRPEEVQEFLGHDERLVSSFGPYHATSRRVILVSKRRNGLKTHELPYTVLESITAVKASDHRKMAIGAVLAVSGLATMLFWYFVVPIVALVFGMVVLFQGSVGRPVYYQLKGRGMEGKELYRWQIKYYGAGSFINSISAITGVEAARPEGQTGGAV